MVDQIRHEPTGAEARSVIGLVTASLSAVASGITIVAFLANICLPPNQFSAVANYVYTIATISFIAGAALSLVAVGFVASSRTEQRSRLAMKIVAIALAFIALTIVWILLPVYISDRQK